MLWKVSVSLILLAVVVAMSGCCSCCLLFTDVIEDSYPDAEQSEYTTKNIAETTGTFTVDTTSNDAYDLLEIQVPDLWGGSKQSFSR